MGLNKNEQREVYAPEFNLRPREAADKEIYKELSMHNRSSNSSWHYQALSFRVQPTVVSRGVLLVGSFTLHASYSMHRP